MDPSPYNVNNIPVLHLLYQAIAKTAEMLNSCLLSAEKEWKKTSTTPLRATVTALNSHEQKCEMSA